MAKNSVNSESMLKGLTMEKLKQTSRNQRSNDKQETVNCKSNVIGTFEHTLETFSGTTGLEAEQVLLKDFWPHTLG